MSGDPVEELIIGIAARLREILGVAGPDNPHGEPEGHVTHHFTSIFEDGCGLLWRMGLATPGESQPEVSKAVRQPFPAYFRLASEAEIRARFKTTTAPEVILEELVSTYIGLACDYGSRWLPKGRDAFERPEWAEAQITALCSLGFLEERGNKVQWTDKAGPAMIRHHFWSQNFVDAAQLEAERLSREVDRAISDMPAAIRAEIAKGPIFAVVVVQRHWTGQGWATEPGRRVGLSFAKKMAELLEKRL